MEEDDSSASDLPGSEEAWTDIASILDAHERILPAHDRPPRIRARLRFLLGAAVVAVCVGAIGLVLWQRPLAYEAQPGVQHTFILRDGTAVHLNSASRLAQGRGFMNLPLIRSASRVVRLDGEAFFDVSAQPGRPFIVQTANARIEVIGTRFNVRARPQSGMMETVVTLAEGRVSVRGELVRSEGHVEAVLDSVGTAYVVRADGYPELRPRKASLERMLAWRERGFAAVDEPVGYILRELELRFAVQITIQPELEVRTPMTVFYQSGTSPEEIIHDICLARGWQYRPASRGFAVFEAPAPAASNPDVNV